MAERKPFVWGASGVELLQTGDTLEGVGSGGAIELLQSVSILSPVVSIEFTGLDETYWKYIVEFTGIRAASDATKMLMQVQTSGVWRTGGYIGREATAADGVSSYASNNANIFDYGNYINSSSHNFGKAEIYHPSLSDRPTLLHLSFVAYYGIPFSVKTYQYNANEATTGVRFLMLSGNILSGVFRLYGLKA